jgi:hypothetical protein
MKKTIIISTVLMFLTTTGCVKEASQYCPPPTSVSFDFVLSSGEHFGERVTAVNVGVFDGDGNYMHTERVGKADLETHEGMDLALPPGDYRFVFWANMNGSTNVEGLDGGFAGRITHSEDIFDENHHIVGQTDPLFYAPFGVPPPAASRAKAVSQDYYPLTIEEEKIDTHIISFIHAYRIIEIFIVGMDEGVFPMVELERLPSALSYNGMMRLQGTVDQTQRTAPLVKGGKTYAMGRFRSFWFDDPEGVEIAISDADGEFFRIPLDEAIEQVGFDFGQITLQLVFAFKDGEVEISMPGWDKDDIGFEWYYE